MKKIVSVIVAFGLVLSFNGCFAEKAYGTGKVIYVGARTAYIELDLHNKQLEDIDAVLVKLDKVHSAVKEEVKKKHQEDVSSLQSEETGSSVGGE